MFNGLKSTVAAVLIFTAILLPLHGCGGGEPETGNAPTIESKEPGTETRQEPAASAAVRIRQAVVRSCEDDENSDFCEAAYSLIARWVANEITDEEFVQGIIDLRPPEEIPVPASPSPGTPEPSPEPAAADDDPPALVESNPVGLVWKNPPGVPRVNVGGDQVWLYFDKPLFHYDSMPSTAFTVIVDGEKRALSLATTRHNSWAYGYIRKWGWVSLWIGGDHISDFIHAGEENITVSYDREKAGNKPLRGLDGAEVASFSRKPVVNGSERGAAGSGDGSAIEYSEVSLITSGENAPAISANGQTITLKFDDMLEEESVPNVGAFTVATDEAEGRTLGILSVSVSGDTMTIYLAATVLKGEGITVSYDREEAYTELTDEAGLPIEGFGAVSVVNRSQVEE